MDAFQLKLLLSFVVGGGYIAFTIWASERFGSKLGGIILGLPSTALISMLFIGLTQGEAATVAATPILPVAMAISSLFPGVFIRLYPRGLVLALGGSLAVWLCLAVPLVLSGIGSIWLSVALAAAVFSVAFKLLEGIPHRKLESVKFSATDYLVRAGFSGSVVAFSVFLGNFLGPLWGGLFAAFPAAFSSSTILLARRHGIGFASSVAKAMPLGSMANVAFAMALFVFVPALGLAGGILSAFLCSVAAAAAIYRLAPN